MPAPAAGAQHAVQTPQGDAFFQLPAIWLRHVEEFPAPLKCVDAVEAHQKKFDEALRLNARSSSTDVDPECVRCATSSRLSARSRFPMCRKTRPSARSGRLRDWCRHHGGGIS